MTAAASNYVILAGIAFDETGDAALREALRVAQLHGTAELHVVHVLSDEPILDAESSGVMPSLEARLGSAPQELRKLLESVWVTQPVRVTAHIRVGSASGALLQTASDIDADVIIIGSHKRRGMAKFLLGSVADQILRGAHCPVLVAVPKDYAQAREVADIEPPCPDCLAARQATGNQRYWCERHSRSRMRPHVYEPSDARSNAVVS